MTKPGVIFIRAVPLSKVAPDSVFDGPPLGQALRLFNFAICATAANPARSVRAVRELHQICVVWLTLQVAWGAGVQRQLFGQIQ